MAVETARASGAKSRPRRRRALVVAAIAIVVAAAVAVLLVIRHERVRPFISYPAYGASIPTTAGTTVYFGQNALPRTILDSDHPVDVTVDVTAAQPLVALNTADAEVQLIRCVEAYYGASSHLIGTPNPYDLTGGCSQHRIFHPGEARIGDGKGDVDLVLAITPRHEGKVVIDGLQLGLSDGLRNGTQHTGAQVKVTVP